MAGYTAFIEKKILEHVTGKTSYTAPAPYIALFTTNPTDASGAGAVETTYGGYARTTASGAQWASATGTTTPCQIQNASALSLPACTSGTATIVGWGLYDAISAGNLMFYGTCSLSVSTNITPQFAAGQLTLSIT